MASLNDTVIKGKLIADDLGTLIREVVITENTYTIDLSGLDIVKDGGTYDLYMHLRTNRAETGNEWCLVNFNGITSPSILQKIIENYGSVYQGGTPGGGFALGLLKAYRTSLLATIHLGRLDSNGYGELSITSNSCSNDSESSIQVHTSGFYFNISKNVNSIQIKSQASNSFASGSVVRLYKRR